MIATPLCRSLSSTWPACVNIRNYTTETMALSIMLLRLGKHFDALEGDAETMSDDGLE
jgi:hypothetical protein